VGFIEHYVVPFKFLVNFRDIPECFVSGDADIELAPIHLFENISPFFFGRLQLNNFEMGSPPLEF
jgi:hypothetical protein